MPLIKSKAKSAIGKNIERLKAENYPPKQRVAIALNTAREAGATNPEQLGEQLALLLDGASARTRVLNAESFPTAAAIAAVLIDNAIPATARRSANTTAG